MSAYTKLRRKRQIFVDAYVETGMLSKAVVVAGYNINAIGKMLMNPEVKAAIAERQEEAIAAAGARRVKFIETLCYRALNAGEDIRGKDGKRVPFDQLPTAFLNAIDSIEFASDGSILKYKLATTANMRMLGDVMGLFKQIHEIAGKDGGPIQTEDVTPMSDLEKARRIAHVLAQGMRLARPPSVLDSPNSGDEPDVSTSN